MPVNFDACDLAAENYGADPAALIRDPDLQAQAIASASANADTAARVHKNIALLRDMQDTGQNPDIDRGQTAVRRGRSGNVPDDATLMRDAPELYRYKAAGQDGAAMTRLYLQDLVEQTEHTKFRIQEEFDAAMGGTTRADLDLLATDDGLDALWNLSQGKVEAKTDAVVAVVEKFSRAIAHVQRMGFAVGATPRKLFEPPLPLDAARIRNADPEEFMRDVREAGAIPAWHDGFALEGDSAREQQWLVSAWIQAGSNLYDKTPYSIVPRNRAGWDALNKKYGAGAKTRQDEVRRRIVGYVEGLSESAARHMVWGSSWARNMNFARYQLNRAIAGSRVATVLDNSMGGGQGLELYYDPQFFDAARHLFDSEGAESALAYVRSKGHTHGLGNPKTWNEWFRGFWNVSAAAVLKNAAIKYAMGEQMGHLQFRKALLGQRKLLPPIASMVENVVGGLWNTMRILARGENQIGKGEATRLLQTTFAMRRALDITNVAHECGRRPRQRAVFAPPCGGLPLDYPDQPDEQRRGEPA